MLYWLNLKKACKKNYPLLSSFFCHNKVKIFSCFEVLVLDLCPLRFTDFIDRGFLLFFIFLFFFFLQPLLSVSVESSCRIETETNLSTWKKQSWDSSGRLLYKRDRGFNFVSEVTV